jgi:hypothetical protein
MSVAPVAAFLTAAAATVPAGAQLYTRRLRAFGIPCEDVE